jgi:hypothetical protein
MLEGKIIEPQAFGSSRSARLRQRLLDGLLVLSVFAAWEARFGPWGPRMDSDVAVHGAMVLRPIDVHFIYYWSQDRLGSLVPAIGKVLRLVSGLPAAEAVQLAVYLCSGAALWIMLGTVRSLPGKLLLAAFCAFPSFRMTENLVSPSEPLPGLMLFGAWQIGLFLELVHAPSRRYALAFGCASAGFLWAGEPALFVFAGELIALGFSRERGWLRQAGWVLVGALPFAGLIVVGKLAPLPTPAGRMFHWQHLPGAWDSIRHLGEPLATLWPVLGAGTYLVLLGLAAAGAVALVRDRRARSGPTLFATLAPIGLISAWGVAVTKWYAVGDRHPRYLTFAVILAVWALALATDLLLRRSLPVRRLAATLAVLLIAGTVVVNPRRNDIALSSVAGWRTTVAWAEQIGCQGVVADYFESYPFFTLSEGRIPATPREGQYVRSRELADEAIHAPLLCVVPWEKGPCDPELKQFGVRRRLHDAIEATTPGEVQRFCRYDPPL